MMIMGCRHLLSKMGRYKSNKTPHNIALPMSVERHFALSHHQCCDTINNCLVGAALFNIGL